LLASSVIQRVVHVPAALIDKPDITGSPPGQPVCLADSTKQPLPYRLGALRGQ
jgi:hypothetical protein